MYLIIGAALGFSTVVSISHCLTVSFSRNSCNIGESGENRLSVD